MDISSTNAGYIANMVSFGDIAGATPSRMKILLLDSETVRVYSVACYRGVADSLQVKIVSSSMTLSTLLSYEVYLVE